MTREEAKELFEDNFTVINTHGHYTKEEEGQAQELAISALKGGWIPVEERKPKHKQEVFVTYETEDGLKVDKTEYHERHGFAISPTVTAWREDIKPYKAEKGGE